MTMTQYRIVAVLAVIAASILGAVAAAATDPATDSADDPSLMNELNLVQGDQDEEFLIQQIRERLMPKDLDCGPDGGPARQFAHLHHMKTGGTSINKVIKCAVTRAQETHMVHQIPYYSLSECGYSRFQRCMSGRDTYCVGEIKKSMVMQFCAPLFAVNHFDWLDAELFTMLRHPVDRIWSMYRFQTSHCYHCRPLDEIFEHIDNNTTSEVCGACESVCMTQLGNHLVRNLLTSDPAKTNMTDTEMLDEAIHNMKHVVTMIGVTEEIATTHEMLGIVFPWLNATVEGSDKECALEHANKSPTNNRCGPGGSHMDLPDHPTPEMEEIILRHNQLDLQLYEEAVKWFALQKKALGITSS